MDDPAKSCSIDEEGLWICSQLNQAIQVLNSRLGDLLDSTLCSDVCKSVLEENFNIGPGISRGCLVKA